MSIEKPVSASMNVTMAVSGPATFCISGPDSDFGNSIKNDFVESLVFSAIQNPHPTVFEFIWPALGN